MDFSAQIKGCEPLGKPGERKVTGVVCVCVFIVWNYSRIWHIILKLLFVPEGDPQTRVENER